MRGKVVVVQAGILNTPPDFQILSVVCYRIIPPVVWPGRVLATRSLQRSLEEFVGPLNGVTNSVSTQQISYRVQILIKFSTKVPSFYLRDLETLLTFPNARISLIGQLPLSLAVRPFRDLDTETNADLQVQPIR